MAAEEDPTLDFEDGGDEPTRENPGSGSGRTEATQPSRDHELAPTLPAPAVPARPGKERGVVTGTGLGPDGTPATPAVDPAAGKVIADRFEVTATLGEGGMGKVFRARDRHIDGREVALKVLRSRFSKNKRFIELFRKEIRAAQEFVSEHVNQVRDTGQLENGSLFLTMDLVHGQTLGDILKREEMLNERHALEVARQVLLGLQSGHEKGFVHRDVKPGNVMLESRVPKTDDNPFGVKVHLLDFGIAGLAAEIEENQVAGTPHYMSPEQIQGQRLDPRSDLFAVGVVLYEMIAGVRPFRGKTLERITTSVMETDVGELVAKLDHLSKPVQQLLSKALQKDRKKRYQSASDFIDAIEESEAYKAPSGSSPALMAATVLFGLVAVAGAAGFWWQQDRYTTLQASIPRNQVDELRALQEQLGVKDGQIEGKQREIDGLQNDVDDRDQTIAGLNSQLGEVQARLAEANTKLLGEKTTLERIGELERARSIAEEDARNRRDQIDQLERELRQYRNSDDPVKVMTAHFDSILGHCLSGDVGSATQAATALANDAVILQRGIKGKNLLIEVVDVLEKLVAFESLASRVETPESVRELDDLAAELGDALVSIENQLESYPSLAGQWFDYDDEGAVPTDRSAALTKLVHGEAGISRRVAQAEVTRAEAEEAAWNRITEGGQGVDPGALLDSSDIWGEERLEEFVGGRADELLSVAKGSGTTLDADSLDSLVELDQWRELIDGDHNSLRNTPSGRDLLLLSLARDWYTVGQLPDRLFMNSGEIPDMDWRKVLLMQMELASAGSPFPTPPGQRALYRESRDSSELVLWRMRHGSETPAANSAWDVDQDIGKGEGADFEWISTAEQGNRIEYALQNLTLVDRRTGADILPLGDPSVAIESIQADSTSQIPPGVVLPFALDNYRTALPDASIPCLVVESREFKRWFSPALGLVKEVQKTSGGATITRDLLFASYVR